MAHCTLAPACLRRVTCFLPRTISSPLRAAPPARLLDASALTSPASILQTRLLRAQALRKPATAAKPALPVKPRPAGTVVGLNSIQDNPGARINRKRWGRGLGSGRGKRSGRGNKGWLNRHSGQPGPRGFEGGQTPFFQVVPKHGVRLGRPQKTYAEVNLDRLQHWIDTGRIDSTKPITISVLVKSGCVRSLGDGVALLAQGAQHFTSKNVDVRVTRASANAIRRVEELGGKIVTSSLSPAERQYHLRPERFAIPPRPSIPMDLNVVKHYISPAKRGNLELEKVGQRAVIRVKDV